MIENASMAEKAELFSNMIVFSSYAVQVVMSFMMLIVIFIILPRAQVSAKRINEILETEPAIVDGSLTESETKAKGEIEFRNVSFRYPDSEENVISDISFKAARGETVAVIGSTGCGKSTLINLIPRFYDVTSGEILVNGVNIKDVDSKKLRKTIGFVPQKGILFTGTIKDNIKYGDDKITDKSVKKALDIAQATEFVSKLKDKEDYDISQGGSNVSGGQKQRLSIARAIAKDPDIYIFDDSFSALDFKTDAKLRKELSKVTKNKTVLIVAQRISTIMNADKIIVLDEGNIVGIGKHSELMKNCKIYQEIALSQLSKEELENA
jgi:ATP-binding cassette subfamily B protein